MNDLFKAKPIPPLAEALRPTTLDEVVGQSQALTETMVELAPMEEAIARIDRMGAGTE